jgi:hypothetical protein
LLTNLPICLALAEMLCYIRRGFKNPYILHR